jgi:hypothetical protein
MGQIIKFQHEIYNGRLNGTEPDIDILYPKTSFDQVEGLTELIKSMMSGEVSKYKEVKSVSIIAGTATAAPKIRITFQDNTFIESDFFTIASTTVHGATKLSSATNSSVENLAATPKAVKTAYDLADEASKAAAQAADLFSTLHTLLGGFIIRVEEIRSVSISQRTSFKINLQDLKMDAKYILDVICYYCTDDSTGSIVRDGVSVGWQKSQLSISSTASDINKIKILYLESIK